jgi:hypothetical protein
MSGLQAGRGRWPVSVSVERRSCPVAPSNDGGQTVCRGICGREDASRCHTQATFGRQRAHSYPQAVSLLREEHRMRQQQQRPVLLLRTCPDMDGPILGKRSVEEDR